ncbi:hypothetical protein CGZ98_05290 [Enemella evansiae]|uniref:histidine phosphatase family protein n=1 Tax=Enemella evansiae TaxID=2016499 RepID=UPI000B976C46|nr:histidine phosphatase family protein [Enemella evansiae]OYO13839.1 hypothetical protein CGZ98_05290 [Enemella evansiae]
MGDDASIRTRVILVRHGEAAYETDGSGDSGGSLTPTGRDQARRLGRRLASFQPVRIVSSELSRAVQTAEIAASALALPIEVKVGLQEYDVGDERGRPYNPALFEPLQQQWLRGDLSAGIPGGEDGHAVARRMFTVLDAISARARGATVVAISHGGAIISVLGSIAAGHPDLPVDGDDIPGCDLFVLGRGRNGWQLIGRDRP